MAFIVIFVERVAVVVRQTVSHPLNERSEMSTQTAESRDVRVLVSFFAAREDGSISNEPLHREKFCIPVSEGHHKDLSEHR